MFNIVFFVEDWGGWNIFKKWEWGERKRKKGDIMPKRFEALYNHPLCMLGRQINNITCKKKHFYKQHQSDVWFKIIFPSYQKELKEKINVNERLA